MPSPAVLAAPAVVVMVPHAAGVKVVVVLSKVSPAGKVSGSWIVVTAPGLAAGLVTVKVSVVLPPLAIVAAPKLLVTVGGVYTAIAAVAAVPFGALALVTLPVLLVPLPALAPNTCTVYVQVVEAGTVPPVSAKLGPLFAAVSVPVHPTPLIAAPGVPLLVMMVG